MAYLHFLRTAPAVTRGVLLWFVLAMTAALASPLLQPQAVQLVCSAAGAVKLVNDQDAGPRVHTLDCVLCTGLGTALPLEGLRLQLAPPLRHSTPAAQHTSPAALTAAPPPGRGPPLSA